MALCVSFAMSAQYMNLNYDKKTTEQVGLNTAMQEGVEIVHNVQVDSIKSRQNKLMGLTATYAGLKDMYMVTLQNAKGFGEDSGIYKSVVSVSLNIVTHSGEVIKTIDNSTLMGKATALLKVADLVTDAAHLGNLFFNIVNNAEVKNPLQNKLQGAEAAQKDKLNLLNRHERLSMALKLLVGLQKIDNSLVMMKYYLQHASLNDLLFRMDRKTWISYHTANAYNQKLIDQWNIFVN